MPTGDSVIFSKKGNLDEKWILGFVLCCTAKCTTYVHTYTSLHERDMTHSTSATAAAAAAAATAETTQTEWKWIETAIHMLVVYSPLVVIFSES